MNTESEGQGSGKVLCTNKTDPLPTPAVLAVTDVAFFGTRLRTMEFFDSSLPVTIFSIWLVPRTIHLFPPSGRSLTSAFLLHPHGLLLITLCLSYLLQVASVLYVGISCTSCRKL